MKQLLFLFASTVIISCGGSDAGKTSDPATPAAAETKPASAETASATPVSSGSSIVYTADGVEIKNSASVLVSKDKDNLQPGTSYVCMLTSNAAANNNEYLTLNFLLDTKPGTYAVVGSSFQRGKDPNGEMYGGLLGGKPKITEYKVTITECKDLGDNGQGGHKWSISGTCEDVKIKATPIMLMDKTRKHPEEVKLEKISFSGLSFDDNWDEMMEKGMKMLEKKN